MNTAVNVLFLFVASALVISVGVALNLLLVVHLRKDTRSISPRYPAKRGATLVPGLGRAVAALSGVVAILLLATGSLIVGGWLLGFEYGVNYDSPGYSSAGGGLLYIWPLFVVSIGFLGAIAMLCVRRFLLAFIVLGASVALWYIPVLLVLNVGVHVPVTGSSSIVVAVLFLGLNGLAVYTAWTTIWRHIVQ